MSVTNFLKKPVLSLPARQELPNLRHFFRRLWLIFGGAAVLLVLSFVVFESVGSSLEQQRASSVSHVNLLGQQRTDSQVLSRLMLQAESSKPPLQTYYMGRIDLVWGVMKTREESIHSGTPVQHAIGAQLADILEKLEQAHGSYLKIAKVMRKLYPRTDATNTLLSGMGETLTEDCDTLAVSLDQAAQKIILVNTDINEHIRLLGWLQIAVTGGIALVTALLLTRGQISTMERLIDTSLRVQELTYLQNAVLESAACGIVSMNTKGLIATFNCGAENSRVMRGRRWSAASHRNCFMMRRRWSAWPQTSHEKQAWKSPRVSMCSLPMPTAASSVNVNVPTCERMAAACLSP